MSVERMRRSRPPFGAAIRGGALLVAALALPHPGCFAGPAAGASSTPPPKAAGHAPASGPALPAEARDACDGAVTLAKSWPATSVDRPEGPVEDPLSRKKRPGCRVHARGSFAALKDAPLPDVQIGTWFQKRGWQENPQYDADGPDGTDFGYETPKSLCFVQVSWDGGDDSDPDYVPEDWFEVSLGCVAKAPAPKDTK